MCIELTVLFVKIAVPWEAISMCVEMLFYHFRKHNLETSGSPLSDSHSLWECWSEDERMHTIAMVLKVSHLKPDHQDIENININGIL